MTHQRPPRRASLACAALLLLVAPSASGEEDYNVQHSDGSYEFGYDNENTFHRAAANARNVVRGEFGGRNPKTGGDDVTSYTAGPRGYRPRGSNIARKFDQSQARRGPIGSPDDPYFDPSEDPSYDFGFKTRTYQRAESANRGGDVSGQYSYVDDVGERHNVEYIAGKKTGFHVRTPFPDSNPKAYGRLFFRGRGRPLPRGRTSIQRGLDGSYRFVAAGPDQRRTEVSDARGYVRGSYTYLDDKGARHAVHYIAGPGIGYRVLKNVKGPHLPSVYPFDSANIIPPDFDAYLHKHSLGGGGSDYDGGGYGTHYDGGADGGGYRPGASRPKPSGAPPRPRPGATERPVNVRPSYDYDDGSDVGGDDLFGGSSSNAGVDGSTAGPTPQGAASVGGDEYDDDGGGDDLFGGAPTSSPPSTATAASAPPASRPRPTVEAGPHRDDGLFAATPTAGAPSPHVISITGAGGNRTIVTNLGERTFSVPPGESVRAHVQSIDLYPYESKVPTPAAQFRAETTRAFQRLTTRQVSADDAPRATETTAPPSTTTTTTQRAHEKADNFAGEHEREDAAVGEAAAEEEEGDGHETTESGGASTTTTTTTISPRAGSRSGSN